MAGTGHEISYRGSMPRGAHELSAWHALADEEKALEPDLPIVDAHHHLFGSAQDLHHYRLADLQSDLSGGHRVVGTVYVEAYGAGWRTSGPQALRPVGEVETIVAATRQDLLTPRGPCTVAAGIVAHVDMTLGAGVDEVLEAHRAAGQGRLSGVRYRTATDDGTVGRFIVHKPAPGLLREAAVRQACARLAHLDLSFDAWVYHHQLDEAIELADACPSTRIVLDHVGGLIGVAEHALRRADSRARWRRAMRSLALRPNVRVKIGGLGMLVFGFGFEHGGRPASSRALAEAWGPVIDECLEMFGAGRCMLESNFPVDKQSCGYVPLWNAFKRATQSLSPGERGDLFHGTACRTYRLAGLERRVEGSDNVP